MTFKLIYVLNNATHWWIPELSGSPISSHTVLLNFSDTPCLQNLIELHIRSTVYLTRDWSWHICQGFSWGHSHSSAEMFYFKLNSNQNSYGVILDKLLINQAAPFLHLHKWEQHVSLNLVIDDWVMSILTCS